MRSNNCNYFSSLAVSEIYTLSLQTKCFETLGRDLSLLWGRAENQILASTGSDLIENVSYQKIKSQ